MTIKNMDSIAQYKIMRFIRDTFYMDKITVSKIDTNTLKVTDRHGESILLEYKDGTVQLKY